jgi:hypothetical protein
MIDLVDFVFPNLAAFPFVTSEIKISIKSPLTLSQGREAVEITPLSKTIISEYIYIGMRSIAIAKFHFSDIGSLPCQDDVLDQNVGQDDIRCSGGERS